MTLMLRAMAVIAAAILAIIPHELAAAMPPGNHSIGSLDERLRIIDAELGRIAAYRHFSGIGPIGYRSQPAAEAHRSKWVEVDLGETFAIDEIVLVPTLSRYHAGEVQADGFPTALRVLAGTGSDRSVKPIAEFAAESNLLPRVAPLIIPGGGLRASWIRIEATTLSRRTFDQNFVFELAEILAFSGEENVALRKVVQSSAGDQPSRAPGWAEAYVTDGILPYVMASGDGQRSVAYVNQFELGDRPISGDAAH